MPEGDTIFRTARTLQRALGGKRITRFETQLPKLGRVHDDTPVTGRTVERVSAHGKWLRIDLSGDLILLTHMLMSGSWHIYRPGERWFRRADDMRIVLGTDDFVAVAFTVPVAEFHTTESLRRRDGFRTLGPDVLGDVWNEQEMVSALRARPQWEIGNALMDQSLMAGVGNVFKSEICFACGIHPFRHIETLGDEKLLEVARTARKFLRANVTDKSGETIVTYTGGRRTTGRSNPAESLWVYGRTGQPCRRCGAAIVNRKQGGMARITFWCPQCQP